MNVLEFIDYWFALYAFAVGYCTIIFQVFKFIKWLGNTILKLHRNTKQKSEKTEKEIANS